MHQEPEDPPPILTIKQQIRALWVERQKLVVRHAAEFREIGERERVIRNSCPHTNTIYHSDPAGGSDSYRECKECGAEV